MAQNKFGPALLILLSVGPALLLFRAVGLSMQIAFSYDHLGQIIVNSPPMAFSTLVVASVAGLSGVTMFGNKYSRCGRGGFHKWFILLRWNSGYLFWGIFFYATIACRSWVSPQGTRPFREKFHVPIC